MMLRQATIVTRVTVFPVVVFIAVFVSGCMGTVTLTPVATPSPTPAVTSTPTQTPNGTFTVIDYSMANPRYATTYPIEMDTHGGNFILSGRITINDEVPSGYVYHLKPSSYQISESNEAVDAIGILDVSSVSMSYSRVSENGKQSGSSMVVLRSFVDPRGNYRISGLNPGKMYFSRLRLFNAPGQGDNSYYAGLPCINLTKAVSRCDLDLTDVEFGYVTPDGFNLYTATGVTKNTDL